MAEILEVHEDVVNGKEGFIVRWKFLGMTKGAAKFRAVGMTAMRFPTTITEVEVVDVEETMNARGYHVAVFIPTEGFLSAGITNPIEWVKERFGDLSRKSP